MRPPRSRRRPSTTPAASQPPPAKAVLGMTWSTGRQRRACAVYRRRTGGRQPCDCKLPVDRRIAVQHWLNLAPCAARNATNPCIDRRGCRPHSAGLSGPAHPVLFIVNYLWCTTWVPAQRGARDGRVGFLQGPLEWPGYMAAVGSRIAAIAALDDGGWHGAMADDMLSVIDAVAAGHGGAPSEQLSATGMQVMIPILFLGLHNGQSPSRAAMPADLSEQLIRMKP